MLFPFVKVGTVGAGTVPNVVVADVGAGAVSAGPDPVVAGMLLNEGVLPSDEVAGGMNEDGVVVATGFVADVVGIVYRVESDPLIDDCPPSIELLLPSEDVPDDGVEKVVPLDELPSDGEVEVRLPKELVSNDEVDVDDGLLRPLVVGVVKDRLPGKVLPRD